HTIVKNKQLTFSTNIRRNIAKYRIIYAIGFVIFTAYAIYKICIKEIGSYFAKLLFNKKTIDIYEPIRAIFLAIIFASFALSVIFYIVSCGIKEEKSKIEYKISFDKKDADDYVYSFNDIKKYNTKKNNFLYLSSIFLLIVFLSLFIEKVSYISIHKIPNSVAKTDVIIETILVMIALFLAIFFYLQQLKEKNKYIKQDPSKYVVLKGMIIGSVSIIASIALLTIPKNIEGLNDLSIELMFLIGFVLMVTGIFCIISSIIIKCIDNPSIYSQADIVQQNIIDNADGSHSVDDKRPAVADKAVDQKNTIREAIIGDLKALPNMALFIAAEMENTKKPDSNQDEDKYKTDALILFETICTQIHRQQVSQQPTA
ncbi:MAG: hypothetical protein OEY79_05000, partial [Anaplasmataceae bacterium]|nr:hypothetical protein [Anaplasmataceae bacterium]